MWNSRNTLEVASNHYSIRHKLLTVCSPPKQSNKICRPQYEAVPRNTFQMKQARFAVVLWWFPANGRGYLGHLLLGFCVLVHLLSELHRKLQRALVQTKVHRGSVSCPLCPAGPECWVIDHLGAPLSDKSNKSIANPLCVVFQPHALMYSSITQPCHCYPRAFQEGSEAWLVCTINEYCLQHLKLI